jgi:hypothetical protein
VGGGEGQSIDLGFLPFHGRGQEKKFWGGVFRMDWACIE